MQKVLDKQSKIPTFHPATTCSTRLGPEDSCFRGNTSCSAFWFWTMMVCQFDTSWAVFSYAMVLWICNNTRAVSKRHRQVMISVMDRSEGFRTFSASSLLGGRCSVWFVCCRCFSWFLVFLAPWTFSTASSRSERSTLSLVPFKPNTNACFTLGRDIKRMKSVKRRSAFTFSTDEELGHLQTCFWTFIMVWPWMTKNDIFSTLQIKKRLWNNTILNLAYHLVPPRELMASSSLLCFPSSSLHSCETMIYQTLTYQCLSLVNSILLI